MVFVLRFIRDIFVFLHIYKEKFLVVVSFSHYDNNGVFLAMLNKTQLKNLSLLVNNLMSKWWDNHFQVIFEFSFFSYDTS